MPWLTDNPLYEAFGSRTLFLTGYGGADFGECAQAIELVGDGDVDSWHQEWTAIADRLAEAADASAAAGHAVSAREAYVRATTYYRTAYYPLYGAPTDERLRATFEREADAFARGAPLWDNPVELVEIPFEEGITLPGVMVRPNGDPEPRATAKKKTHGKTASGKPITDEMVEKLAKKAEAGYDVDDTLRRRPGRPAIGSAPATVESVRLEPELRDALAERADRDDETTSEANWGSELPAVATR